MASGFFVNDKLNLLLGWRAVSTDQRFDDIDLDVAPIQIQTNSIDGSYDLMWMRFLVSSTDKGPGFYVYFWDQPVYGFGFCTEKVEFTMPPGPLRVWTISKENGKIKLNCNGVDIAEIDYMTDDYDSHYRGKQCKDYWGLNFGDTKFLGNATDYVKQYSAGTKLHWLYIFSQSYFLAYLFTS